MSQGQPNSEPHKAAIKVWAGSQAQLGLQNLWPSSRDHRQVSGPCWLLAEWTSISSLPRGPPYGVAHRAKALKASEKEGLREVTVIWLSNDRGQPITFPIFCLVEVTH